MLKTDTSNIGYYLRRENEDSPWIAWERNEKKFVEIDKLPEDEERSELRQLKDVYDIARNVGIIPAIVYAHRTEMIALETANNPFSGMKVF